MELSDDILVPSTYRIFGFNGTVTIPKGEVTLRVSDGGGYLDNLTTFYVVDVASPYEAIIGRPWIAGIKGVASAYHQRLRFPTYKGIAEVVGDPQAPRQCMQADAQINEERRARQRGEKKNAKEAKVAEKLEKVISQAVMDYEAQGSEPSYQLKEKTPVKESIPNFSAVEPTREINLGTEEEPRVVRIGSLLSDEQVNQLVAVLKENMDTFAWNMHDMEGIDPEVCCHHLRIDPSFKPVRQKMRLIAPELQAAVENDLKKLQESGIIRKSHYPQWISNMVVVPKRNRGVRICIDFRNLNKACPKDSFPLPSIDQLVESIVGYEALTLMYGYAGYNQIPLAPEDQEHTSFFTPRGLYCYSKMSFGLKNAGATYQRMVGDMFEDQIHNTIEVYVDDMLGIEADPEKVRAILEMPSSATIKHVQKLSGSIAALGRFISRSSDKCKDFFSTLKKGEKFKWTDTYEEAFQNIKLHLGSISVLQRPEPSEVLTLYLGATSYAISAVLVLNEGNEEKPVYFISKTLIPAEKNYTRMEQMILALAFATLKLRTYFQAHRIRLLTKSPIEAVLDSAGRSGRISKWGAQIKQFNVFYEMRTAVKAQVVADFLADFPLSNEDEVKDIPGMEEYREDPADLLDASSPSRWEVFVDGASNKDGSGLGIVFTTPKGRKMVHSFRLEFKATNNVTEYEAAISRPEINRRDGPTICKANYRLTVGNLTNHRKICNSRSNSAEILGARPILYQPDPQH
ncbi:uncharacterized protein LOC113279275 [Papaver somniferum]|uniref:uncharacterized protein LOC113279275 n=1 Tax=Papaver somniferum TaxID=3469 RepID=UPI000E704864|nr:uncharacterized protein LOC113279275 [Papaver somniferum]